MKSIEVKFLFNGIIFSTDVFVRNISKSMNRYEFSFKFLTKYLISKYSNGYNFIFENNRFSPVNTASAEESELIKALQETIYELSHLFHSNTK